MTRLSPGIGASSWASLLLAILTASAIVLTPSSYASSSEETIATSASRGTVELDINGDASSSDDNSIYDGGTGGGEPGADRMVVHDLGIHNFESILSSHEYTIALFYDRLDDTNNDINFAILDSIAASASASAAAAASSNDDNGGNGGGGGGVAYAKLDIRRHSYLRRQYCRYGINKTPISEYYADYDKLDDPPTELTEGIVVNHTTFMRELDNIKQLYWPSQWTIFQNDFNVYGILHSAYLTKHGVHSFDGKRGAIQQWITNMMTPPTPVLPDAVEGAVADDAAGVNETGTSATAAPSSRGAAVKSQVNIELDRVEEYDGLDNTFNFTNHYRYHPRASSRKMEEEVDETKEQDEEKTKKQTKTSSQEQKQPIYATGAPDGDDGTTYYRYPELKYDTKGYANSGILNNLEDVIERYFAWVLPYEEFWTEERQKLEDEYTNFGTYLQSMNRQVYDLLFTPDEDVLEELEDDFLGDSKKKSNSKNVTFDVPDLKKYYQEMIFGYGRSPSSLRTYLDENVLGHNNDHSDNEDDSDDDSEDDNINTNNNKIFSKPEQLNTNEVELFERIREFMYVCETFLLDDLRYAAYFARIYTGWYDILIEFQDNLSNYYVDYQKRQQQEEGEEESSQQQQRTTTKPFNIRKMDVLDMSNPNDKSILSSYDEFERLYTAKRQPVVLSNVNMTTHKFTLEHLVERCGHMDVTDSVQVSQRVGGGVVGSGWGGLSDYELPKTLMNEDRLDQGDEEGDEDYDPDYEGDKELTLEQFVNLSKELDNLYLHDFGLPRDCDRLFYERSVYDVEQKFRMPSVIGGYDLFQRLTMLSYQDSWPSLFIGRKYSNSKLHVDSGASAFVMYLVSGRKRWVTFDESERPFLYERIDQSSFVPDVLALDREDDGDGEAGGANEYFDRRFPLLRRAVEGGYEWIQEPGQLVYIPPNTPHAVENLEDSIGISFNLVPRHGIPHHLHHLIHCDRSFASVEIALRYIMFESMEGDSPTETKDELYTSFAEYKNQA